MHRRESALGLGFQHTTGEGSVTESGSLGSVPDLSGLSLQDFIRWGIARAEVPDVVIQQALAVTDVLQVSTYGSGSQRLVLVDRDRRYVYKLAYTDRGERTSEVEAAGRLRLRSPRRSGSRSLVSVCCRWSMWITLLTTIVSARSILLVIRGCHWLIAFRSAGRLMDRWSVLMRGNSASTTARSSTSVCRSEQLADEALPYTPT